MADLTEKEIEQISEDIDQQGLTYVELKNEILDHICCEIELQMDEGTMFNQAYQKVREAMGKKRIRQIQDETLNLISKKYRRMKRVMYVLGVAAPVLVIIASLFKIMHWPGASIMLTLGLFIVGMIFLPLFVMSRIRDTRRMDEPTPMGLYISGMITGMLSILGALFKIMHWPGASILLCLGLLGFAFVFLPIYASAKLKEAKANNKPANRRLIIGGVIAGALLIVGMLFKIMHWPGAGIVLIASWSAVAILFIPFLVLNQLKQSDNRINNFFSILVVFTGVAIFIMALIRSEPKTKTEAFSIPEKTLTSNADFLGMQADRFSNEMLDSDITENKSAVLEITSTADAVCDYIQSLKKEMVPHVAEDPEAAIDKNGNIDFKKVYYKNNSDIAWKFIVATDEYELFTLLKEFRKVAIDQSTDPVLSDFITQQLSLGSDGVDDMEAWANKFFKGPFLQSAIVLSMYQSTVRLIEYELLKEL